MQVDAPPDCTSGKTRRKRGVGPLVRSARLATWNVSLQPYDLVAARFSAPHARVRNPVVSVPHRSSPVACSGESTTSWPAWPRRRVHSRCRSSKTRVSSCRSMATRSSAGRPAASTGGRVALDSQPQAQRREIGRCSGSTGQRSASPAPVRSAPTPAGWRSKCASAWPMRSAHPRCASPSRARCARESSSLTESSSGSATPLPCPAVGPAISFPIDNVPGEGLSNLRVRLDLLSGRRSLDRRRAGVRSVVQPGGTQ